MVDQTYDIDFIPYPIASLVKHEDRLWLIDKISSDGTRYSLVGHSDINNEGGGKAWIAHSSVGFLEGPTADNWGRVLWLRDKDIGSGLDEDDDDSDDDSDDDNGDDSDDENSSDDDTDDDGPADVDLDE